MNEPTPVPNEVLNEMLDICANYDSNTFPMMFEQRHEAAIEPIIRELMFHRRTAPDMLEALENAAASGCACHTDECAWSRSVDAREEPIHKCNCYVSKIRAAIAKAKGE